MKLASRGRARLFPLPDLVMFPHVMQPLHIFEPRYREMLNEALDSDGLIAMSILARAGKPTTRANQSCCRRFASGKW